MVKTNYVSVCFSKITFSLPFLFGVKWQYDGVLPGYYSQYQRSVNLLRNSNKNHSLIPDQEIPVTDLPPDLYNKILEQTGLKLGDFRDLYFKIFFDKRLDTYFCGLVTSDRSSSYNLSPETSKEVMSFLMSQEPRSTDE
jgi:hypothetical protein